MINPGHLPVSGPGHFYHPPRKISIGYLTRWTETESSFNFLSVCIGIQYKCSNLPLGSKILCFLKKFSMTNQLDRKIPLLFRGYHTQSVVTPYPTPSLPSMKSKQVRVDNIRSQLIGFTSLKTSLKLDESSSTDFSSHLAAIWRLNTLHSILNVAQSQNFPFQSLYI